jgi:hypothetical protein
LEDERIVVTIEEVSDVPFIGIEFSPQAFEGVLVVVVPVLCPSVGVGRPRVVKAVNVGHDLASVDDSFTFFGAVYPYYVNFELVALRLRPLVVHHQLAPFYESKVRADEKFT